MAGRRYLAAGTPPPGARAGWRLAQPGRPGSPVPPPRALLLATPLKAQETSDPTNLFGERGLMGTPSARMAPTAN